MRTNRRCLSLTGRMFCLGAVCVVVSGCGGPALEAVENVERPPFVEATGGDSTEDTTDAQRQMLRKEPALAHPFPRRAEAPSLAGAGGWFNTAGPLDLKDLRGKFVVLDFWTYCCINCMHVLPELKKLEQKYPNTVAVIGVHSAKFTTEQQSDSIRQAIMRYEIDHPVVNDADRVIWERYACQSWPTLRVIDPEGNLVAGHSGEISFEALDEFLQQNLPYYRQTGLLDERPLQLVPESSKAAQTALRYPGKILADAANRRLFIADSNHNRIVICSLDGKLQQVIGDGQVGNLDGDFATARFNHPQGMALVGETLYVADTENHLLRKVDLQNRRVSTIAGIVKQPQAAAAVNEKDTMHWPSAGLFAESPKTTRLRSPWALWVQGPDLYVAMAGSHQIWKMPLDESEIGPYAGNGREDIVDGSLLPSQPYAMGYSSFAQPSGLASDGRHLFVADSEGSSVRAVPFDPAGKVVTVVGTANLEDGRLFEFGDVDGRVGRARLQHCLDVAYDGGKLYVADTYNHKIKVIDLDSRTCKTLAGTGKPGATDGAATSATFFEPAGLSLAEGRLYVADTNSHLIRVIDLSAGRVTTLPIEGLTPH